MFYTFILGREPGLSLAELISVLPKYLKKYSIAATTAEFLLISTEEELDTQSLMKILGGTIKIGKVFAEINTEPGKPLPLEKITSAIVKFTGAKRDISRKIFFGLSYYSLPIAWKTTQTLGLSIKKEFSQKEISGRFVTSREKNLSAVTVKLNKLLSQRGLEVLLLGDKEKIYLAETLTVQPFDEFSQRDYGRPGRDSFSGMLPPKLALIMINLTGADKKDTLLDPFCGSGTVVTEALLAGFTDVWGSDITDKAVVDAKENLEWQANQTNSVYKQNLIKQCDATELSKCYKPNFVDAIATEPYLGPPLKGWEKPEEIERSVSSLTELYTKALKEMAIVVKKSGTAVMIWPIIQNKKLPLEKALTNYGWKIEPLLPPELSSYLTERKTLTYSRPDQKLKREIVRLKKIPV